jgi:hypothetical protein
MICKGQLEPIVTKKTMTYLGSETLEKGGGAFIFEQVFYDGQTTDLVKS